MQPTKYAAEFQINSTIAGVQKDATVVALTDGRFVAAWTDASGVIRGRIFGADATPVGADFVIGTGPAAAAGHVHLTALSAGGFAATWQEAVGATNVAIVAQVFSNTGVGGAEFQVSAAVAEDRILAEVIQLSNGNLKFVYQDQAAVPSVLMSTYSTAGVAVGVESPVTAITAGAQTTGLVNLTGGKYAVVSATGGAGGDVQLQIFNNAGTALAINGGATPYIVNTTTSDTQVDAKVALLAGGATTGDLAVTWTSTEPGGGTEIRARIVTIDNTGTVVSGPDFLVHTSTVGNEVSPAIAATKDGGFVVAWLDTTNHQVKAQYISGNGTVTVAEQVIANTNAIDDMAGAGAPTLTTLADGRFVVSWTSANDTDGTGIHAQIFDPRTVGFTAAAPLSGSNLLGDSLVGTALADEIRGNGGDDTLFGGAGSDTIYGGLGVDHMIGGDGSDVYVIDNIGDTIIEASTSNSGQDIVESSTISVDLTKYANTENAALLGSAPNLSVTGTDGNNTIYADVANASNTAANELTGGLGNDTYYVGVGDKVVELAGGGFDKVVSAEMSIDASGAPNTFFANVEEIELLGTGTWFATGNAAANILRGDGNTAANVLTGGDGNDTYWLGAGDTIVEVATPAGGTDTINTSAMSIDLNLTNFANAENVTLRGTADNLDATGNSADNILSGEFNSKKNVLTGGNGNDTYNVGALDTVFELATVAGGIDTINTSAVDIDLTSLSFANAENVTLSGALALNAIGNTSDNTLRGDFNSAINTLTGGLGNDTYYVGAGDIVHEVAGGGDDAIYSFSTDIVLSANVEVGLLFGSAADLDITGNSGDNRLFADQNTSANKLTGGAGDDTYVIGLGDTIFEATGAAGGNDRVLTNSVTVDLLTAAFRNVETIQLNGNVALNAFGDNFGNLFYGDTNTAINILTGRGGDDRYVVGFGDKIVEVANGGFDTVFSSSISLNLANYAQVENVHIIGDKAGLNAIGNIGNNILSGEGNSKANNLTGLAGNDTYRVGVGDKVFETATGGNDTVSSASMSLNLASYLNVENIQLEGATAWSATGNAKANTLNGETNTAANVLSGLAGDDTYFVGTGDRISETATGGRDTVASSSISLDLRSPNYANVEQAVLLGTAALNVTGNAKANLLQGNDGNNVIWGGAGNDTLIGKAGRDTFAFKTVSDSGITNASRDVITDFVHLVDRIDLAGIDANAKVAGNQAFSFLAAKGAAFTGHAGQLHYVANGANTLIEGDTNGDGVADFQLFLIGAKILTGTDFIL